MHNNDIERIVIVGGGTAGWMAAAAFCHTLNNGGREITLIESDVIGTVGVGEATIPPIIEFNARLGIPENEFIAATQATFKLGIEFCNWGQLGDRYFHPFGDYGFDLHGVHFHQLWLREHLQGRDAGPIADYSMATVAGRSHRFGRPGVNARPALGKLRYAFHFDAGLYARYLRGFAELRGVQRQEGKIVDVIRNGETGFVEAVRLADGQRIEGDLFIDCSGFAGLLIEQTLGAGYEDWSHWLPMDRAWAVPTGNTGPLAPYTRSTAHMAGWQWRIPLQHRTGNGHVFASRFMDEREARDILLRNVEGPVLGEPRMLRFVTGRRKLSWSHNVVALGLASGFLEPLESTSIHLIQNAIARLLTLFPDKTFDPLLRDEFNRGMQLAYEDVRDFIILHYKATQRSDSPFWNHVREMEIPDSLQHRMSLFRSRGRVLRDGAELFTTPSWVAVMLGQNLMPAHYDPLVDSLDPAKVAVALRQMRQDFAQAADALPTQEEFLRRAGAWNPIDPMTASPLPQAARR